MSIVSLERANILFEFIMQKYTFFPNLKYIWWKESGSNNYKKNILKIFFTFNLSFLIYRFLFYFLQYLLDIITYLYISLIFFAILIIFLYNRDILEYASYPFNKSLSISDIDKTKLSDSDDINYVVNENDDLFLNNDLNQILHRIKHGNDNIIEIEKNSENEEEDIENKKEK